MSPRRLSTAFLTSVIVLGADARHLHVPKHEAVHIARRQVGLSIHATPTPLAASCTTPPAILTYITPSPGAAPVGITEESQLVTSYIPQFTLCELPTQAVLPVTPSLSIGTANASRRNFSSSIPPGNVTCTTIYSETATMICATILTGLVQKYTVTNCAQDITFSTEYGFALDLPTASANVSGVAQISGTANAPAITSKPIVQRLTTYYLAPWQAITAGTAPDEVTLKVCASYGNGTEECTHQYEVWHTSLITQVATRTASVDISTTIHGMSQVIVETFVSNVTAAAGTTFSMSTDIELEYKTELLTTEREAATSNAAPTHYLTITVENATPSSSRDSTTTRTSTIHRTSTTTIYIGTTTEPLPSAAIPSEGDTAQPMHI